MPDPPAHLTFRPAFPDELARAASLREATVVGKRGVPPRCFVAIKDRPVERIVGAAFWHVLREDAIENADRPERDAVAELEWSMIASLEDTDAETEFLQALQSEVADQAPHANRLVSATWQLETHPQSDALRQAGFDHRESRQVYAAQIATWRDPLAASVAQPLPDGSSVDTLTAEHFQAIDYLVCGGLSRAELVHGFQTASGQSPSLFDPRCSAVLITGAQIVGTCLANVHQTHLTLAALSGTDDLAIDHLVHRVLDGADNIGAPTTLSFQVANDDTDTTALADLARRLKVEPASEVHRFRKDLGP